MHNFEEKLKEIEASKDALLKRMNQIEAEMQTLQNEKNMIATDFVKKEGAANLLKEMMSSEVKSEKETE